MILKIRNVFFSFLLFLPCWQAGPAAAATTPPADADLAQLVDEALANNPEIRASEERWQMTVSRADQAGALEDPMLMFQIQNGLIRDPVDFDRDAATSKVIGLRKMMLLSILRWSVLVEDVICFSRSTENPSSVSM